MTERNVTSQFVSLRLGYIWGCMTIKYTGRCQCGGVAYEAVGDPVIVAQCHCEQCRRLSGTGHTVGAMFTVASVTMRGRMNDYCYISTLGSKVTKSFCRVCGSPICGRNSKNPDHVTIALGSMDDAKGFDVHVVIFDRDKQCWDQLEKDVLRYDTQPEFNPKN
jgi:hypothetical protein